MTARFGGDDGAAALAEEPSQPRTDGAHQCLSIETGSRREGRDAEEYTDEGDALHPDSELRSRRVCARESRRVECGHADPAGDELRGPPPGWRPRSPANRRGSTG